MKQNLLQKLKILFFIFFFLLFKQALFAENDFKNLNIKIPEISGVWLSENSSPKVDNTLSPPELSPDTDANVAEYCI